MMLILSLVLSIVWAFSFVEGIFVGTILLPHGDFALDPTFAIEAKSKQIANHIAFGSRIVGQWLENIAKPEIIIVTTPHGVKLEQEYGIYMSNHGTGQATIGKDIVKPYNNSKMKAPYNVSLTNIELASVANVSQALLKYLQSKQDNYTVTGIYSYDDTSPIPLNWGEIIPLLLLPSWRHERQSSRRPSLSRHRLARQQRKLSSSPKPKPLIWTFPYRRYSHSIEMIPELLDLGQNIMNWIVSREEKIGVIISGDLAHTHLPEGPYGYSNTSALYDTAIRQWIQSKEPCHTKHLLQYAKNLQPNAKSCGFTGYVLWHGMMCGSQSSRQHLIKDHSILFSSPSTISLPFNIRSKLLAIGNVTYYGMCAAIFEPEYKNQSQVEKADHTITTV